MFEGESIIELRTRVSLICCKFGIHRRIDVMNRDTSTIRETNAIVVLTTWMALVRGRLIVQGGPEVRAVPFYFGIW
jgi:hypothetical protein